VTNTGAALQPGDTFHVFNKGVTGAGSMYVGGGGVAWNNQLAANGRLLCQLLAFRISAPRFPTRP